MSAKYANQEVSYLVIGAGIAGLMAAQTLQAAGYQVQVLDKGRGVGGRMATRRIGEAVFDHGAQYFSVRDPLFRSMVSKWQAEGVVKVWEESFLNDDGDHKAAGSPRYRGAPGMTAVPKALASGLDIRLTTRIEAVTAQNNRWQAHTDNGEVFEGQGLIMTPPVPQALALLERGQIALPGKLKDELQGIHYNPCTALLVVPEKPVRIPSPGGVRVRKGSIRWIADNQQKGVSPQAAAVTIHASPDYSSRAWDMEAEEILRGLLAEASPWVEEPVRTYQVQRWRYAQPKEAYPLPQSELPGHPPLHFAGDAFGGGRVEGAALSGLRAAQRMIE